MTARRRLNGEGSFYRTKSGGYRAYVWVTLPDGRRRRKYVYGQTREEVQATWTALQEKARRGPVVPKSPTVQSYMTSWLDNVVRPGLAPSTTQAYEMCLRLYIAPLIGTRRLDRLTVSDVQGWVNKLRRTCQCCSQGKDARRAHPECCAMGKCCGQLPSDSTVHQAWRVLRAALSSAQRDELVHRNVASLVRMPMPRSPRAKIWTAAEAARFLQSASTDHDPMYAAYVLLLVLGLRRGEVLGIAWDDVDLEKGQARIAWQLQRVGHELRRTRTKTRSSEAVLPLPDVCLDALRRRREEQQAAAKAAGEVWHDSGLVFTSSHRHPDGPAQLPPLLQGARRGRRRPGDPGPLDPAHLRLPARRARRPPARDDADPPAQPDRRDHGHLRPGRPRQHPRRPGQARQGLRAVERHPDRTPRCCKMLLQTTIRGPSQSWKWASDLRWSQGDSNP